MSNKLKKEQFLEKFNKINKHNIKIIGDYNGYNKPIKCECEKGHIIYPTPDNLLHGKGCSVCNNKQPLKGYNTFGDKYPEKVNWFKNPEDAYKYTYGSGKKVTVKCNHCQSERQISLNNLRKYNEFPCQTCKDGISIPNKFIRNIILLKKICQKSINLSTTHDGRILYIDMMFISNIIKRLILLKCKEYSI